MLKAARLVADHAEGTRRVYRVDPRGVEAMRNYLDRFWDKALAAFKERAFRVFTEKLDSWWPRSHKIGASALKKAMLEPRVQGRWYEIDEDGSECEWGKVLVWEPPVRLVLSWQIDQQWKYDPRLFTEVEVRFVAEGSARTRVELEHRKLEAFGEAADMMRGIFESDKGWGGLIAAFAAAAKL